MRIRMKLRMEMKKNRLFTFAAICIALMFTGSAGTLPLRAAASGEFKFPQLIDFSVVKNNKPAGTCRLICTENWGRKGYGSELASLKFINFQGFGIKKNQEWHAGVYREDLSLFIQSVSKAKDLISQVRIIKGTHADGKEGLIYVYREKKPHFEHQEEIHNRYKVIDFLSALLLASHRVAAGMHQTGTLFNWVDNRTKKIVVMEYKAPEIVTYQGKKVPAEVMVLKETGKTTTGEEIAQIKILKNDKDNWFPVSIQFKDQKEGTVVLNAVRVSNSETFWGGNLLFMVHLPFMDIGDQSINRQTDLGKFMDGPLLQAFRDELDLAAGRWGKKLKINIKGHTLPISDEQVKSLVLAALNPDLTEKDKMEVITGDVMKPGHIDGIITGQYAEFPGSGNVIVRPIIIFKDGKNIITEKWEFKTGELMCLSQTQGGGHRVLCRDARDRIANLFKFDWQDITSGTPGTSVKPPRVVAPPVKPSLAPLYAANLGFMDTNQGNIGGSTEDTRLILQTFESIMLEELRKIQKKQNKRLVLDAKAHTVPASVNNIEGIISQAFNQALPLEERIKQLVTQIMDPHHVDGIITGHYIFVPGNPVIRIRPVIVFKTSKRILTANLQFTINRLVCLEPGSSKRVLCKDAVEIITREVRALLSRLH